MKDTTLKVLSWILIVWTSLGVISTLGGYSDTMVFELLFEGLIIFQAIRTLKHLS